MSVATVILTAGLSQRMGYPKALLKMQGESLINIIVERAILAGSDNIIVVTADSNEGFPFKKNDAVREMDNLLLEHKNKIRLIKGKSQGHPIDSLRYALAEISPTQALCLWPIDYPFADLPLLKKLFSLVGKRDSHIVVPVAGGKRGHPVLFGKNLKNELLSPLADQGANRIVHRKPERVLEVISENTKIYLNLNTRDDIAAENITID
tara:strand:- start:1957 stop:2580 length:624 start_codon:yes stop_codon:yes gene_type:complete